MANALQQTILQPTQFYRLPTIKQKFQVSGSSVWAWVKAGKFPKPIKLSERCTAWDSADVERWAADRITASQHSAGGEMNTLTRNSKDFVEQSRTVGIAAQERGKP